MGVQRAVTAERLVAVAEEPSRFGLSGDRPSPKVPWATLGSILLHASAIGALYWIGLFPVRPLVEESSIDFVVLAPEPPAPTAISAPPEPSEPPPVPSESAPMASEPPLPPVPDQPAPVAKPPPTKAAKPQARDKPRPPPSVSPPPIIRDSGVEPSPPVEAPPPVAPAPPQPAAVTSEFANLVFERINRIARRTYPETAILRRQQGKVTYHLVIGRDGELLDHSIDPSGIGGLDRAAEQALTAAAPFPKPPDMDAKTYRMSGVIYYHLEN